MSSTARYPVQNETQSPDLTSRLARSWWVFVARGFFALIFGGFALYLDFIVSDYILRAIALAAILIAFAFYLFCSGIMELSAYISSLGRTRASYFLLLDALVGLSLCAFTISVPGVTTETMPRLVATYAILLGINDLGIGLRTQRHDRARGVIILAGILMLAIGAPLLTLRTFDSVRVVHALAIAAFCIGGLSIWTGWEFSRNPISAS